MQTKCTMTRHPQLIKDILSKDAVSSADEENSAREDIGNLHGSSILRGFRTMLGTLHRHLLC